MTDRELMQQALEALEFYYDQHSEESDAKVITALRERLAQPDAYGYASRLAVAIWEKHYKDAAPQWKPLDDLMGVLTQIDNMTSGLTRLAQPETVMAEYKFQTYAAYKTDGEMKIGVVPEQEPIAWGVFDGPNLHDTFFTEDEAQEMVRLKGDGSIVKPLYATPPRREWVGLTDEEIAAVGREEWVGWPSYDGEFTHIFRLLEAKLKERNNG